MAKTSPRPEPVDLSSTLIRSRLADVDARIAILESEKVTVEQRLGFARGRVLLGTPESEVGALETKLASIVDELEKLVTQRRDLEPFEAVAQYRDMLDERAAKLETMAKTQAEYDAEVIALPLERQRRAEADRAFAQREDKQFERHMRVTSAGTEGIDARIAAHRAKHADILRAAGAL